jgi:hypothetical protein
MPNFARIRLWMVLIAACCIALASSVQVHGDDAVLNNLDVQIYTFYQGEFDRPTFSLWGQRIDCGTDLDQYNRARCGPDRKPFLRPATDGISGNRCGFRGFALACIKMQ